MDEQLIQVLRASWKRKSYAEYDGGERLLPLQFMTSHMFSVNEGKLGLFASCFKGDQR